MAAKIRLLTNADMKTLLNLAHFDEASRKCRYRTPRNIVSSTIGAAIQAVVLTGVVSRWGDDLMGLDVVPFSGYRDGWQDYDKDH